MTEQDIVDLEIERQSCIKTAFELCRDDGYMDSAIKDIVDGLRSKAERIEGVIKNELQLRLQNGQ